MELLRKAAEVLQPLAYDEILQEARMAQDTNQALASVTHALCAIGLDLLQTRDLLREVFVELEKSRT